VCPKRLKLDHTLNIISKLLETQPDNYVNLEINEHLSSITATYEILSIKVEISLIKEGDLFRVTNDFLINRTSRRQFSVKQTELINDWSSCASFQTLLNYYIYVKHIST